MRYGLPVRSKNFNIDLREVTLGTHLRKHLRLLVGYCQTSVTGSHARLDHNVNSESTCLERQDCLLSICLIICSAVPIICNAFFY